jgi:hypothetical protein
LYFLGIAGRTLIYRGALGLKSLRGNGFYKSHRDIAEKALKHLKILAILEKASISPKKSSKIIEIKTSHF